MEAKERLETIKALSARIMGLERENRELKKEIERYVCYHCPVCEDWEDFRKKQRSLCDGTGSIYTKKRGDMK